MTTAVGGASSTTDGAELEERFEGHSFDLHARNTTRQSANTPIRNGHPG